MRRKAGMLIMGILPSLTMRRRERTGRREGEERSYEFPSGKAKTARWDAETSLLISRLVEMAKPCNGARDVG